MTGGFRLRNIQEECERIIDAPNICLETSRTGEHYRLARFHTNQYYNISSAIGIGRNRAQFNELLIGKSKDQDINLHEVRVMAATGFDAGLLAGTLQHYQDFREDVRITYMHERDGELTLRDESVFGRDEGVLIVHTVAVSFNGVERAIRLVQDLPSQPYVAGFLVLLDRSPVGSQWRKRFIAFKHAIGMHRPIEAYHSEEECPSCEKGIRLLDVREAA
ncbi:MAG: hypothetical protein AAB915_01785 [Patescibacteria group bacterium]